MRRIQYPLKFIALVATLLIAAVEISFDRAVAIQTPAWFHQETARRNLYDNAKDAQYLFSETISIIDKSVQKGGLHCNATTRHKARLTGHVTPLTTK